ncbi:YbaK/EbsC family protein [Streptomyces sp. NPDC017993]|uniref:YbaK/EbsC family protein n=1 Tax=Streptomyces sp. NPDC017993 TaxID=3365027 RepID=UPI0037ACBC87
MKRSHMAPHEGTSLPVRSMKVARVLASAGIAGEVRVPAESTRRAAEAASASGCDVGPMANSLVFISDDGPVLVQNSGRRKVDTTALATWRGSGKRRRATPEQVRQDTGQVIVGVAPGHPRALPTVVDEALTDYAQVWAAARVLRRVFSTTAGELLQPTGGLLLPVGR